MEYPHDKRCKHYLIPEQCAYCTDAVDANQQVEPHVRERIQTFRLSHMTAARHQQLKVRATESIVRRQNRRRQRGPVNRVIPLHKNQVIGRALGSRFDPHDGPVSPTMPAHLRRN